MSGSQSNRPGRRATIRDVAQRAGLSIGTVSHVLNDSKSVSDSAREAVRQAVASLDYRPNSLARSLIARRARPAAASAPDRPVLTSVGYISIDYMVRVGKVPTTGARTTSHSIDKMLGGPAANVAAFAAGLGAPLHLGVEMVTRLGNDADSFWALEELAARNIDASGAVQQPGDRLSRCIVLVEDDGQRTIINEPFQVPVDLLARHMARPVSEAARACVHFDGFHLGAATQVGPELRAAGYLLSLHSAGLLAVPSDPPRLSDLLEVFDLLFLDQDTFARIADAVPGLVDAPEEVFELASASRCQALLLTRGAEGAILLRPGTAPVSCPAPRVAVVDATGAGDAFAGVFLASWLTQGDLEAALAHAVHGASLSVTALGAQGRLPEAAALSPAAVSPGA